MDKNSINCNVATNFVTHMLTYGHCLKVNWMLTDINDVYSLKCLPKKANCYYLCMQPRCSLLYAMVQSFVCNDSQKCHKSIGLTALCNIFLNTFMNYILIELIISKCRTYAHATKREKKPTDCKLKVHALKMNWKATHCSRAHAFQTP